MEPERLWDLRLSVAVRIVVIGLIVYEAATQHHPRVALLGLYGTILGAPSIAAVFAAPGRRRRR